MRPWMAVRHYRGADGDQRPFTNYDSEVMSLSAPRPDLAVSQFEVLQPHATQGLVEIHYELSNHGEVNSQGFWLNLHLSDQQDLKSDRDPLVWRKFFAADAITGMGTTGSLSTQVQLPRDVLYERALADDPRAAAFGTSSTSAEWLHLSIEPESSEGDSLVLNNTRSDAITYFPWDVDGNGKVSMADAIEMVNRIGQAPASEQGQTQLHDLNGDLRIDQTEVMAVVERVGLSINKDVF